MQSWLEEQGNTANIKRNRKYEKPVLALRAVNTGHRALTSRRIEK